MKSTLMEVAKLAGVSTATVNRVLKGNSYVSAEARQRVQAAIERTGYRPNIFASGLRTSKSFTVGHVVTSIITNPFFVTVARGFEAAAVSRSYSTMLFDHGDSAEQELAGVQWFLQRRVDGIVFNHALSGASVEAAREAGLPVVEIERSVTTEAPFVRVDNAVGARAAMQHLLQLGHRRIAFIGGDPRLFPRDPRRGRSVEEDRLGAYTDVLRAAGIPVREDYVRLGVYTSTDPRGPGTDGLRHAIEVLRLDPRPTAIFATCDILAAGVLQAIYAAGLRVPSDISVIGFDDTLALNLTPQLTTVAQPMAELGALAFQRLEQEMAGAEAAAETVLPSHLILRESTAAAP